VYTYNQYQKYEKDRQTDMFLQSYSSSKQYHSSVKSHIRDT